jgi:tetratricopeptide (TPR) repeat protein
MMMLVHRIFRSMTGPFWRQFLPRTRARAWVFFRRGDEARDSRRWDEAVQFYERGLELCPNRFAFWVQLGHVLKEAGDHRGAQRAYLRALRLRRDDHDLHVQLGHLYSLQGDVAQARRYYARAVGLGSRDHHALHFLARIPQQMGEQLSQSIEALLEAKRHSLLNSTNSFSNLTELILRHAQ